MTQQSLNPLSQVTLADRTFTLERFPLNQKNRSLQAWDAADEYLANYLNEEGIKPQKVLIINDAFGALSCYLADSHIINLTDSFVSQQATKYNLAQNDLADTQIDYITPLDQLDHDIDLVLIKIPKNAGFLTDLLAKLSAALKPQTPVIAAGKVKEIHTSTISAFERFMGATHTSLAVKKSRLIFTKQVNKPQKSKFPVTWQLENSDFTITNHANVFSRDSLDIGARFFINYLPQTTKKKHIVDLGCGNGVIGLLTQQKCPNSHLTFVDESAMAVASAKLNLNYNLPEQDADFVQNDCLSNFPSNSQDIILCNPPFHQQQAVTDHIAWQMFVDAHRVLREGGEIRIVGNRHLDYHEKLKRLFGGYKLLGSNKKFVVLSAKKRTV